VVIIGHTERRAMGRVPRSRPGRGCHAPPPGYDLASGLGTVDAALLVPELAGRPLAIARSAPLILPRRLP